jgi:hypothetical protein
VVDDVKVDSSVLKCAFLDDVVCSYRKDEKFGIMNRCFKCPHYLRFEREMAEEEERFFDEVDEANRTGVLK